MSKNRSLNRSLVSLAGIMLVLFLLSVFSVKSEAFAEEVSPVMNKTYEPGETIEVRQTAPDLLDISFEGYEQAHSIAVEIYKGSTRKYRDQVSYYADSEGALLEFQDFTPTEEGTYTVRIDATAWEKMIPLSDPLTDESSSYVFEVKTPVVESIQLSGVSNKIAAGKSIALQAQITPSTLQDTALKWKSSNPKVASVNSSGVVKGKKAGTATITATAKDSGKKNGTYKVTVVGGVVTKITLTPNSPGTCFAGDSIKFTAKVTASSGANKKIRWTSSNSSYATVSQSGKAVIKEGGRGKTVRITAEAVDGSGVKKTVKIKISPMMWGLKVNLTSQGKVSIKKGSENAVNKTYELAKGKKFQFITAGSGRIKSVKYTSSNKKIVSITNKGVATAKKTGTAVITVKVNKKVSAKVKIKVRSEFPYKDSKGRMRYQMMINGKIVDTDTPPYIIPDNSEYPMKYFPLADVLDYAGIQYSIKDDGQTITGTLYGKEFYASAKYPEKLVVNEEGIDPGSGADSTAANMVDGKLFVPKYFFAYMTDKTYCDISKDGKSLCIIDMPIIK